VFEFHKFPLTKPLADKFRENVSGSKDGRPDWVNTIAIGSGPGLFGPGSAVWQVHGCIATLDQHELNLLGLKKRSKIWLRFSRVSLDIFLAILGPEPPAMQVARERIERS
jgi:hypothetical protein